MVTRVSTFGLFKQANENIMNTQKRIKDLSIQINSGKVSRDYKGIAEKSSTLVNLENEMTRIQQYRDNAERTKRRLNKVETNINSILDRATDFRKTLLGARNDKNYNKIPLDVSGKALYNEIAAYLNAEQDDRFLFAGDKTGTPPVKSFEDVSNDLQEAINAGGAGLDIRYLAPDTLTNAANGLPIRAQQVMDFFTNDSLYGAIGRTQQEFDLGMPIGTSSLTEDGQVQAIPNYVGNPFDPVTAANPLDPTGSTGVVGAGEHQELRDFQETTRAIDFSEIFYQGNSEVLTTRLEDEATLDYNLFAEADGFEQVLLAAWIIGDSSGNNGSPVDLEGAQAVATREVASAMTALPGAVAGDDIQFTVNGVMATVTLTGVDPNTIAADINMAAGAIVTATVITDKLGNAKLQVESKDGAPLTVADAMGASAADIGIAQRPSGAVLDMETRIDVALEMLQTALKSGAEESLTNLRSEVGGDLSQIKSARDRHNQFEMAFEETLIEIEDVNIAMAATRLANARMILESSFLSISSVSQLSLANFLR